MVIVGLFGVLLLLLGIAGILEGQGPIEIHERYFRDAQGRTYAIVFDGFVKTLPTLESFFGGKAPPAAAQAVTYNRIGLRWGFWPALFQRRIYLLIQTAAGEKADVQKLTLMFLNTKHRLPFKVSLETVGKGVEWQAWRNSMFKGGFV